MIITIGNQKGGVCKTTIATILAAGLTRTDKKTLSVDLDPQCSLSYSVIGCTDTERNAAHLFEGKHAAELVTHTKSFGDIITGSLNLATLDTVFTDRQLPQKERCCVLKKALADIAGNYDYIIIDTPPAFGTLTINALVASDEVIIPVTADGYSVQALMAFIETLSQIRQTLNADLKTNGIVFNRFRSNTVFAKDIAEAMTQQIAQPEHIYTYAAKIRESVALKEAAYFREDIFSYAPKSNVACDCAAFVEEFMQRSGL